MKYLNVLSRRTFLLAGLVVAFFTGHSTTAQGGIDFVPPGDLTVTVEEQGDGAVKFTLSGTAYMQSSTCSMYETNHNYHDYLPPFLGSGHFDLPEGLTLTVPSCDFDFGDEPPVSEPEESPAPSKVLNIFGGGGYNSWSLAHCGSGFLFRGDAMTGAGSVTTRDVPFHLMTPGTYVIEAGGLNSGSESEDLVSDAPSENTGYLPYSITYKVIAAKPSLAVSGRGAFPKTALRKRSRVQQVLITNDGSAPLTGLNFTIAGKGATEFTSAALPRVNLPAGASTLLDVRFRPKRNGMRRATLTVTGVYTAPTYPAPTVILTSAEEGANEQEDLPEPIPLVPVVVPAPVTVSGSVALTGQGLSGKNRTPHAPRFPNGRR